ncbi:hypothetical protein Ancab_021731 [Ancistrocladus abbreviatus]
MENPSTEVSQPPTCNSNDEAPRHHENLVSELSDYNGATESEHKFSKEEVREILGVITSTGKFWHDWDELKGMLSCHLKQVLDEYPEAKMSNEEQNSSLGETYPELVKRLDEALMCFQEGPPFTLQRLCEILLDAQGIYPRLSKLALALEKNLLVTTTLTKSTDPYPPSTVEKPDASKEEGELPLTRSNSVEENGGGAPPTRDMDEIMTEVEEAGAEDMTIDMEPFEEIVPLSENSTEEITNP